MRILDVSPIGTYPPSRGSAVRIYNLLRQLATRHDVRQFSLPSDDAPPLVPRLEQLRIAPRYTELRYHHPLTGAANAFGMRAWFGAPLLSGIALAATRPKLLTSLLRWAEIVLVEFPWQFDYCLRRFAGKCVLASHNVESLKFAGWALAAGHPRTHRAWLRYVERLERRAARTADLVLAVSAEEREHYIERYGVRPARVIEVPNGADTTRFAPLDAGARAGARRELGLPERPTVIYVAARNPANRRGAEWVRRLAAATSDFTFLAVGAGARIDAAPPNVVCTGVVDDVRPYLNAADIGLCPIEHGAGTKIKLLESMAAGLPTVAFRSALHGVSAHGAQVVVVEPSVRALREAIQGIAANPERAAHIGRAARALVVERYDWAQIAQRLEAALRASPRSAIISPDTRAHSQRD